METFLNDFVAQLSLGFFILGISLSGFYPAFVLNLNFPPQAPWLSPFL